jgi:GxxExxY protein
MDWQEPDNRADQFEALVVDAAIEVERIHTAQLLSYLKSTGLRLGLLLNFGQARMHAGIRRLVNTL